MRMTCLVCAGDMTLPSYMACTSVRHNSVSVLLMRVTWLVHVKLLFHGRRRLLCDMTHSYVWHDSASEIYWTWLIDVCDIDVCDIEPLRDMTHPCVWHDSSIWHDPFMRVTSLIYATWLIHACEMTHSCVWHDSTIVRDPCDMTPSCVQHDSFMRVTWLNVVTWLLHACDKTQRRDMTHLCVWNDSFIWHGSFTCVRSRGRSDLNYFNLQIHRVSGFSFEWRGLPFPAVKNLCEILGTLMKNCLKFMGTPVKSCLTFWQS